ncbi:MAG: hypothetical protein HZA67_12280 [Rhodospirillales bacterium]|nr:hypothetical protein [Rhodospirillales bacterium]
MDEGLEAILERERSALHVAISHIIAKHVVQTAHRGLALVGSPVHVLNCEVLRQSKSAIDRLFEVALKFCAANTLSPQHVMGMVEETSVIFVTNMSRHLLERNELAEISKNIEEQLPRHIAELKKMALRGFVGSNLIYCHQGVWASYRSWLFGQLPKELVKHSLTTALGLMIGWLLWGFRMQ